LVDLLRGELAEGGLAVRWRVRGAKEHAGLEEDLEGVLRFKYIVTNLITC